MIIKLNFKFIIWCLMILQDYLAPEIFSHFVMHGTSISEIIKHLITALRKTANDEIPTIFLEALKRVMCSFFSWFLTIISLWQDMPKYQGSSYRGVSLDMSGIYRFDGGPVWTIYIGLLVHPIVPCVGTLIYTIPMAGRYTSTDR